MQIELIWRPAGLRFVTGVMLLSSTAFAQQIPPKAIDPPTKMSVAGGPIACRTVDPLSSDREENRIRSRLSRPWGQQFHCSDLQQLVAQLNTIVPTSLNERSLDEIGLAADQEVRIDVGASERPLSTLSRTLKSLDLTWTLRGGRCTIESVETAEYASIVRVYDVTPLVVVDMDGRLDHLPVSQRAYFYSLSALIQTTIRPDCWEAVGGPSSFGHIVIGQRCLLTIATATETHLEIESLLNRLNQLGHPHGLPRQREVVKKSTGLPKFGRSAKSLER